MQKFQTKVLTNEIQKTIDGLNKAADVITSTMGGTGKNVIISETLSNKDTDNITFTKDGVSVAREIRFQDPEENIGAQLLINAANKTVDLCGDGTTLTSLFTKEFVNHLFNENADMNLLDTYEEEIEKVKEELIANSTKIENIDDIYKIAFTSCKSSRIAAFIRDIYLKTGLNANISLEESRTSNTTYYELTEGLTFDSGFVHSGFSNQDNGNTVFENPFFILNDGNIQNPDEYEEVLDELFKEQTPVVFLAASYSDAFIRFCLNNKARMGLQIVLIKFPGYGAGIKENKKDIISFLESTGYANKIVVTPYQFTIYNNPDKLRIKKRVDQLKKMAEAAVEEYDEKDYLNRIHNLQQTSAIIYVGGVTQKNAKEEYDRIEDAVGAIKSALKLGYVRGAGVELANMKTNIETLNEILKKPYYKIIDNAGFQVNNDDIPTKAFNVRTRKEDDNIIDPTYVITNALDNSFALAKLLINTSYIVHNE